MTANDGRHHYTTHRARTATLSAACCGHRPCPSRLQRQREHPQHPPPAPATSPAGASGPVVTLTGAGSTFDAPFFDLAFAKYHQQHPAVTVRYSAVGSSAGIAAFTAQHADFGASDVPMTASEQAAARGGPSSRCPSTWAPRAWSTTCLPAGARLHLTGPVIARIFLGQITNWHDPAITTLNPGVDIPERADHRRAPLRRQRHHLHLQQLPLRRLPGLGRQGRHRQDAALAGRRRARKETRGVANAVVPHRLLHRLHRAGPTPKA